MIKKIGEYFSENKGFALILITVFIFLISAIDHTLLSDWDECIYAEYASNMKENSNFLVNYWNDSTPAFEKLPFYSVLLQIPYLFGVNEFTSRILTVLMTCALLIVLYEFSKKYFSKTTALLAVLILMTGDVFVRYTYKVNTDIGFALCMLGGIFAWLVSSEKGKGKYVYLSGLLFGLAVLIKGPSIAAFLAIAGGSILFAENKLLRIVDFIKMVLVLLVVVLPWNLYLYSAFGSEFTYVYFYENLIQKVKYPVEFHFEGRLYYLKLIGKEFLPWIAALLFYPVIILKRTAPENTIVTAFQKFKNFFFRKSIFTFSFYFVCSLIVLQIIVLTQAATRIAWYIIPVYPFIAIILARAIVVFIEEFVSKKWKQSVLSIVTALIVLDAAILLLGEVNFGRHVIPAPKEQVAVEAQRYPQKKLNYYVEFSERQARAVLPQEYSTSVTWRFGGNACAQYYSGKETTYFYDPVDFLQSVKRDSDTIYLINNGDFPLVKDLEPNIQYRNTDYTLFIL